MLNVKVTGSNFLPRSKHPCEHSRINILQWILTKLGTYFVFNIIWNPIDFQGHRSMVKVTRSNFYARGYAMFCVALVFFIYAYKIIYVKWISDIFCCLLAAQWNWLSLIEFKINRKRIKGLYHFNFYKSSLCANTLAWSPGQVKLVLENYERICWNKYNFFF